ncbi:hypothetical protein C1H76_6604 [Elsinoe australis]|uniref:Uncharacterized protein n=1 Tax=Elsinoe australis TaxID=40998 RepID=A0A4U7AZ33_9PEZI|nr:hypothetical protein C1H76_6604 [Elsinoe australis]
MISVKALSKLLTNNVDGKLILRWFITTPNGSLLAYSTPVDMRELRDQVALISMTWKEQLDLREDDIDEDDHDGADHFEPAIHTMTMEFENRNLLVRHIQSNMLLVLEGGVPPRRSRPLQITTEGPDDSRYPFEIESDGAHPSVNGATTAKDKHEERPHGPGSPTGFSEASTTTSVRRRNHVLDIHRRKLDAMSGVLKAELRKSHFEMPADPEGRFF